jgi:hypothetical protein
MRMNTLATSNLDCRNPNAIAGELPTANYLSADALEGTIPVIPG